MPKVKVWPAITSVKVSVVFSAVVAVPSRVMATKPVCTALAVCTSALTVPPTLRLAASLLAMALVNTTVLGPAKAEEKFTKVPVVLAALVVAPAASPAKAEATVAAVAPPAGAV